jgi:hypothetical protein
MAVADPPLPRLGFRTPTCDFFQLFCDARPSIRETATVSVCNQFGIERTLKPGALASQAAADQPSIGTTSPFASCRIITLDHANCEIGRDQTCKWGIEWDSCPSRYLKEESRLAARL